jgi:prolyl-tRNA editing enzyme YbaK/EbsC (Cys-tRNA(Pro) deacylase)
MSLTSRIERLEQLLLPSSSSPLLLPLHSPATAAAASLPTCSRVASALSCCPGSALATVPSNYYELPLSERAALLGCSVAHLCKTLIFENTGEGKALSGPCPLWQRRYVAVVLQYQAKLDVGALSRCLAAPGGPPASLCMAAAASELTGFTHNGMTIFGCASELPIILASAASELPFLWLGGGEVHVKARVFLAPLKRAFAVTVLPISSLRGSGEEED